MDKASILRTLRGLNHFYKWIEPDFKALSDNLNSFQETKEIPYPPFLPPYPPNQDNITSLIEHIINNDDMASFKALNEIYSNIGAIKKYRNDLMAYLIICNAEGLKEGEERVFIDFLTSLIRDLGLLDDWLQSREPEEELKTSKSKAGRKRSEFKDFIKPSYKDKAEDIIRMLMSELDGLKGKAVAIVLIAAIKNGYIVKPEKASFDREFGNHIDKDSYSRYMREEQDPDLWRSDEVRLMQSKLKL